jgi:hypothetical protein
MQILTNTQDARATVPRPAAGEAAAGPVDAVLTATRSLGAAAEQATIARYRALAVLASRGPQRTAALAGRWTWRSRPQGRCATDWSAKG